MRNMLSRAAGVGSWELAFLLLLRVGVLSVILHPTATDDCEFHRGSGMLRLMKGSISPTRLGSYAQKSGGPMAELCLHCSCDTDLCSNLGFFATAWHHLLAAFGFGACQPQKWLCLLLTRL